MNKRYLSVAVVAVLALPLASSSCGGSNNAQKLQKQIVTQDVTDIENEVALLRKVEPLPVPKDSAALRVQGSWYTADADPNKTWYVTLIALDGTPYMHFDTRGAPQPAGDQVTNPSQLYCAHNPGRAPDGCGTIGLPEPNGVHQGTADQTYIAVLSTGAIMRFTCGCVISDQPFTTKTPIKLSIDETQAISHTDPNTVTGAVVPRGTGRRK